MEATQATMRRRRNEEPEKSGGKPRREPSCGIQGCVMHDGTFERHPAGPCRDAEGRLPDIFVYVTRRPTTKPEETP
jgi:hypothetical protein